MRTALHAGEHGLVDRRRELLAAHDHRAARAAQGLVRGRRNNIAERDRILELFPAMRPAMCAMSAKRNAPTLSAIARKRVPIERARVCGKSGEDHLRLFAQRDRLHFVHVDELGLFIHEVRNDRVKLSGKIQRVAVRKMTALVKGEAEHFIARLQERHVDGQVRAAIRESGCTFTCSAPKSCFARSIASVSA